MRIHLLTPDLGRVSGGSRYNTRLVDAAAGRILLHRVPGTWPHPADSDIQGLHRLLADLTGPVLVDGLIGCSLPHPLSSADTGACPLVLLVHMPRLHEDPKAAAQEETCLQAASGILATSDYTAAEITERTGLPVGVAAPGHERRPLSVPTPEGRRLLCLGTISEVKNQHFLAEVLRLLDADPGFHCTFAGPVADPAYAVALDDRLGLLPPGSWTRTGELDADGVARALADTDLLLLPSRYEAYGLVVTEAAAAGVPAFVTAGTGAQEALVAGRALPLDTAAWVAALNDWLNDPELRQDLQASARDRRPGLPGWEATAAAVCSYADELPGPRGGGERDG